MGKLYELAQNIQQAIDACAAAGGGTVVIPKGNWLTGPLFLRSNVRLGLLVEAVDLVELDARWNVVQTFSVRVGYSNWRPSLYGPPLRL